MSVIFSMYLNLSFSFDFYYWFFKVIEKIFKGELCNSIIVILVVFSFFRLGSDFIKKVIILGKIIIIKV